jgi:hypothetical protein
MGLKIKRTARKGLLRDFLNACKLEYKTICVWSVGNPVLEPALVRYGFSPEVELDGMGPGTAEGFRRDKNE